MMHLPISCQLIITKSAISSSFQSVFFDCYDLFACSKRAMKIQVVKRVVISFRYRTELPDSFSSSVAD